MPYHKPPVTCPVCKEEAQFKFIQDYKNNQGNWSLYECSRCKVQFWEPFKSPGAEWYEFQPEVWRLRDLPHKKMGLNWEHKEFLKFFKNKDNKGKKLLDLGCGTGEFLNAARKIGFEVWGVDFNGTAIKNAKGNYDLDNLYAEPIEDFLKRNDLPEFDVITLFEVIEHVDDVPCLLGSVSEKAKEGAFIILSTPDCRQEKFFDSKSGEPPQHLSLWDIVSLRNVLRAYKFEVRQYQYGNEVELYISRHLRFNTIKKLQGAKPGDKEGFNRRSNLISLVYKLARLKDRILIVPAWLIVKTKKIFNLSEKGTCIFAVAEAKKS